jgi:hypothetical protein
MIDARAMSGITGGEPAGGGATMLVCRVSDVDAATQLCLTHGAALVAAPADRPDWGSNLRTSHLRAPEDVLIELQSY